MPMPTRPTFSCDARATAEGEAAVLTIPPLQFLGGMAVMHATVRSG